MANLKISIIIPVYNVEDYLLECLKSVCSQSLSEIEVICINDGSKDGSEGILRKCAEKDVRIRIINQENQGVASARNRGIQEAKGTYVYFMDADDRITPNYLEGLYEAILKYDCDIAANENILYYHPDDEENNRLKLPRFLEIVEITPKIFERNPGRVICWNKLFKTDFLRNYALSFPKLSIAEDICFYKTAIVRAGRIAFSESGYYIYCQHAESLIGKLRNGKGAEDHLKAFFWILDDYQKSGYLQNYFPPISLLKNYIRYSCEKRAAWMIMRNLLKEKKVWRDAKRWADRGFLWMVCYLPYSIFECKNFFRSLKTKFLKKA